MLNLRYNMDYNNKNKMQLNSRIYIGSRFSITYNTLLVFAIFIERDVFLMISRL